MSTKERDTASHPLLGIEADDLEKKKLQEDGNQKVQKPPWVMGFFFGFVVPGLGMLTESYYIITTGQVKSIWSEAYPKCWDDSQEKVCNVDFVSGCCNMHLRDSISYLQFAGIMLGMIVLGFLALYWSIKSSAILTVSCMGIGAILMSISGLGVDHNSDQYLNILYAVFVVGFTLIGFGVGGEYPVASVNQTERAEEPAMRKPGNNNPIRGSSVQLMFTMQGWGAVLGSIVILILLLIFHIDGTHYDTRTLELIWRITYILGLPTIVFMFVYRIVFMQEPKFRVQQKQTAKEVETQNGRFKAKKLMEFYWHRLLGTSFSWLLWDVSFYGNKLFSGPIVAAMLGKSTLTTKNVVLLIINVVSLIGYYVAAYLLDKKWYGRTKMQAFGFIIAGLLFLVSGIWFSELKMHYKWLLILMYLIINFFGQLGPNATTYILPSELFPTEMRTATHGISAFSGKLGALIATVVFVKISNALPGKATEVIFLICAVCGIIGAILTVLFVPNVSHLDLAEADIRWRLILEDKHQQYEGEAINKQNLSIFETVVYKWQVDHKTIDTSEE